MVKWFEFHKGVILGRTGSNSEYVGVGWGVSLAWVDSVPPQLPFWSSELQLELEGSSGPDPDTSCPGQTLTNIFQIPDLPR